MPRSTQPAASTTGGGSKATQHGFARDRYEQLIADMHLPSDINQDVVAYLNDMQDLHYELVIYQSRAPAKDYINCIYHTCVQLKRLSRDVYEMTQAVQPALSHTLKGLLEDLVNAPYRQAMQEVTSCADLMAQNQQNTCRRFAEQAFLRQNPAWALDLKGLLQKIQKLFKSIRPKRRCFISYAWPTGKYANEAYVQSFLVGLHEHLNLAGIQALLDIKDNRPGSSIPYFTQSLKEDQSTHVLLICTESLKDKHESPTGHVVHSELSLITERYDREHKALHQTSIYPALLSGELGWANPAEYKPYRTVRSFRDQHYLEQLKDFIEWVYLGPEDSTEPQAKKTARAVYHALWQDIKKPILSTEEQVKEQLSYHLTYKDKLQATLAYQHTNKLMKSCLKPNDDRAAFTHHDVLQGNIRLEKILEMLIKYYGDARNQSIQRLFFDDRISIDKGYIHLSIVDHSRYQQDVKNLKQDSSAEKYTQLFGHKIGQLSVDMLLSPEPYSWSYYKALWDRQTLDQMIFDSIISLILALFITAVDYLMFKDKIFLESLSFLFETFFRLCLSVVGSLFGVAILVNIPLLVPFIYAGVYGFNLSMSVLMLLLINGLGAQLGYKLGWVLLKDGYYYIAGKPYNYITQRLLLTGVAGVGKTTLTRYLPYLWAQAKQNHGHWGKHYPWAIHFTLRRLLNTSAQSYGFPEVDEYGRQLSYDMVDILIQGSIIPLLMTQEPPIQLDKKSRSVLYKFLKKQLEIDEYTKPKLLLFLDGYDEIAERIPAHLEPALKSLLAYRHIILTSRPYHLNHLLNCENGLAFLPTERKRFELTGFSNSNIQHYIHNFFSEGKTKKTEAIRPLIDFVERNPTVHGTCRVPINLELISTIWFSHPFDEYYLSMGKLYRRILYSLSLRYLKKSDDSLDVNNMDKEAVLRYCKNPIGLLERFGFESATKGKLFLILDRSLDYLFSSFDKADHLVRESIVKQQKLFGFIKPDDSGAAYIHEGASQYYFNHLTFRDHFAARYLAACWQQLMQKDKGRQSFSHQRRLVSYYPHRWQSFIENQRIETWLSEYFRADAEGVISWFIAGELAQAYDQGALVKFFELFKHTDIIGYQYACLLTRALDELGDELDAIIKVAPHLLGYCLHWLSASFSPNHPLFLDEHSANNLWRRWEISPGLSRHKRVQQLLSDLIKNAPADQFERIAKWLIRLNDEKHALLSKLLASIGKYISSSSDSSSVNQIQPSCSILRAWYYTNIDWCERLAHLLSVDSTEQVRFMQIAVIYIVSPLEEQLSGQLENGLNSISLTVAREELLKAFKEFLYARDGEMQLEIIRTRRGIEGKDYSYQVCLIICIASFCVHSFWFGSVKSNDLHEKNILWSVIFDDFSKIMVLIFLEVLASIPSSKYLARLVSKDLSFRISTTKKNLSGQAHSKRQLAEIRRLLKIDGNINIFNHNTIIKISLYAGKISNRFQSSTQAFILRLYAQFWIFSSLSKVNALFSNITKGLLLISYFWWFMNHPMNGKKGYFDYMEQPLALLYSHISPFLFLGFISDLWVKILCMYDYPSNAKAIVLSILNQPPTKDNYPQQSIAIQALLNPFFSPSFWGNKQMLLKFISEESPNFSGQKNDAIKAYVVLIFKTINSINICDRISKQWLSPVTMLLNKPSTDLDQNQSVAAAIDALTYLCYKWSLKVDDSLTKIWVLRVFGNKSSNYLGSPSQRHCWALVIVMYLHWQFKWILDRRDILLNVLRTSLRPPDEDRTLAQTIYSWINTYQNSTILSCSLSKESSVAAWHTYILGSRWSCPFLFEVLKQNFNFEIYFFRQLLKKPLSPTILSYILDQMNIEDLWDKYQELKQMASGKFGEDNRVNNIMGVLVRRWIHTQRTVYFENGSLFYHNHKEYIPLALDKLEQSIVEQDIGYSLSQIQAPSHLSQSRLFKSMVPNFMSISAHKPVDVNLPSSSLLQKSEPDYHRKSPRLFTSLKSSGSAKKIEPSILMQRFISKYLQAQSDVEMQQALAASLQTFRQSKQHEAFQSKVKAYGLALHDVERDGNCFFSAVLDQLQLRCQGYLTTLCQRIGIQVVQITQATLRRLAVGGLMILAEQGDELILSHTDNIKAYIQQAAQDAIWAGPMMSAGLCRVLGITVVLLNSDANEPSIIHGGDSGTLYLGYEVQRHFQSTRGTPNEMIQLYVSHKTADPLPASSAIDILTAFSIGAHMMPRADVTSAIAARIGIEDEGAQSNCKAPRSR